MADVNRERLVRSFFRLTEYDAESFHERKLADHLKEMLKQAGLSVTEDTVGDTLERIADGTLARNGKPAGASTADSLQCRREGSAGADREACANPAGNIFAVLPAYHSDADPILLVAHSDTVRPGNARRARLVSVSPDAGAANAGSRYSGTDGEKASGFRTAGRTGKELSDAGYPAGDAGTDAEAPAPVEADKARYIASDGTTVLGADDEAGIAEILELLTVLKEQNIPHPEIEVLITSCEEPYCLGSRFFDFERIRAKEGYVLDMSERAGRAASAAPAILSFEVTVTGKSAHAGFEPEQGIHAIRAAASAVAEIEMGHIDEETTVNIGTFNGGKARNIVPDRVVVTGEIRSLDDEKADARLRTVRESFERSAREIGADVSFSSDRSFHAYKVERNDVAAVHFEQAVRKAGLAPEWVTTFGGSDNNRLREHGICGLVVGCGYWHAHSTSEYADVGEMEKSVRILLNLVS